jgi:hypothetical protein
MASGHEDVMPLSDVVDEFKLRFGAVPLMTDDELVDLRVEMS